MELTVFFLTFLHYAAGAKILFFCPIPARSHQKMYQTVWTALAQYRHHHVYTVTPNPVFNGSIKTLFEYDISSTYDFQERQIRPEWKEAFFHKPTFIGTVLRQFVAQWIGSKGMQFLYEHPEVKRLVKEHNYFDVCIFEWFHPAIAIYSHLFNCPSIGIGSNSLPIQMLDAVGNHFHPITAPEQDLPILRDKITFGQKLWSVFWAIFVRLHHKYVLVPQEDAQIRRYYGEDVPYLGDLERNLSLIILNRNPVFHRPVANLPAVVELGGINYKKKEVQVDMTLKKFLDESTHGIIYFSLGISMKGMSLPSHYVRTIQDVFSKLPYDVLWKWENTSMPNKPANVHLAGFIPQVYVLEHPNVRLFITQGGLQSIEEAISAHKPIIGIPFHSDQTTNVDTCVSYGMGKMLDLDELTEENLSSSILDIMNNYSSYAEQAKRLDDLMKDQPQDGLDKAIWWIEYIIRHKGAKHLRSMAADLPWYQYLMLDIYACLVGIALLVILIVYLIFKASLKAVKWVYGKLFVKAKDEKRKSD
ncbi:UDP-glycosyltransferase UGT5-like isoform X1 [Anthonomus grandis grandis]|uniref:UDP-glycosyltransferase UGT5-like isoform X1 n=1 Tax=Anthonomus grandis grandis TaxID=2921223 RepID=UPI00216593B2|nr:UDP-glycosyltransferase UGT5-like isoform X1 [Anthonomus grandis grandis]